MMQRTLYTDKEKSEKSYIERKRNIIRKKDRKIDVLKNIKKNKQRIC